MLQNEECRNYFASLLLSNEKYVFTGTTKKLDYYSTETYSSSLGKTIREAAELDSNYVIRKIVKNEVKSN